ncbi:hypothetical protein B5C26_22135 [Photorhabdus luminescens]|uniref:hypothetical protein n=1 Tax=Photorhabdus luminescens TaxID=29488 RepID=UPI000B4CF403|nr:hypothetical protein [Photorhabdus luminescens]OWO79020.1 hypothetical protein B5C26_22135 [Photorhabdus luminescens]
MDLKITGRWAVICAASEGLGFACASALAKSAVNPLDDGEQSQSLKNSITMKLYDCFSSFINILQRQRIIQNMGDFT